MPRSKWTNPEQDQWLTLRLREFSKILTAEGRSAWLLRGYEEWCEAFPLRAPDPTAVAAAGGDYDRAFKKLNAAKLKQFKGWFKEQNRPRSQKKSDRVVLPLAEKKKHKVQEYHAYLRIYGYRVNPLIEKRWEEFLRVDEGSSRLPPEKIVFIAETARNLLKKESDEVKKEVKEYCQRCNRPQGDDGTGIDIRPSHTRESVHELQRNIDCIPATLTACMDNLSKLTGWVGLIITGGPDPRTGIFRTYAHHTGRMAEADARFDQVFEGYAEFEQSFATFSTKCFEPNEDQRLHDIYNLPQDVNPASMAAQAEVEGIEESRSGAADGDSIRRPHLDGADVSPNGPSTIAVFDPKTQSISVDAFTPIPESALSPLGPPRSPGASSPTFSAKAVFRHSRNPAVAVRSDALRAPSPTPISQGVCLSVGLTEGNPPAPLPPQSPSTSYANSALSNWRQDTMAYLTRMIDHRLWQTLCSTWLMNEESLGFAAGNRLPTAKQPLEVSSWISRGRQRNALPHIEDVDKFGVEWGSWWMSLQPLWRKGEWPPERTTPPPGTNEWGCLNRGGINGIFLLVASLGWWWVRVVDLGKEEGGVILAANDLTWMLDAFVQSTTSRLRQY